VAERMLKVADATLYRSKKTDRNRVTAAILREPAPQSGHDFPLKDMP
jgi:hypothetical protein